MKVQNLARELNKSTRELIGFLREMGIFVKSGSTKLDPQKVSEIRALYSDDPHDTGEEKKETVVIPADENITVKQLSDLFGVKLSEVMFVCLQMGLQLTVNSEVDADTISALAEKLEIPLEFEDKTEENKISLRSTSLELEESEDSDKKSVKRPPVITIMGHVDHGKTLLLDTIRSSNVVAKEAGGITQHIGAYQVQTKKGELTFLDTPGHEAFTALRARGAQITDITILVVAADDGIKPQTVEAISHAKAADVPIIVAINKIDKPDADIDNCLQQLANHDLLPEDWGGQTTCVPISAKTGKGIDDLLEMVSITAEVLELKTYLDVPAKGIVIESQLDKQRGAVASVLVKVGTLRVGDFFVIGAQFGKIKAMLNDLGERVKEAKPGTPVEILGCTEVPLPGDVLEVTASEKESRALVQERIASQKNVDLAGSAVSLEALSSQIEDGELQQLNLIVKADVNGSLEAIVSSIQQIESDPISVQVRHAGIGGVTENDVALAQASNALVIAFNVPVPAEVQNVADKNSVELRKYRIIYEIIDEIERVVKGLFKPEYEEIELAEIEVRQIFKFSKVGKIAGSYVLTGKAVRNCQVKVMRDGKEIYQDKLVSLKRFKDDVKDVASGFECGVVLENGQDIQEGDRLLCFEIREKKIL